MIERGVVKFFNDDKKFGFVTVMNADGNPTEEELFFHYNNGYFISARRVDNEPRFQQETGTMIQGRVRHIKKPEKGAVLVFTRSYNSKGPKVAMWGYASTYDELVRRLANRPVFRVVRSGSNYGQDASGVVWQGQDIMELSARYPKRSRTADPRGSHDMLAPGSGDGGDMHWFYSFEQQLEDGTWRPCGDPRVNNCCVPRPLLRRHNSGYYQDRCFH